MVYALCLGGSGHIFECCACGVLRERSEGRCMGSGTSEISGKRGASAFNPGVQPCSRWGLGDKLPHRRSMGFGIGFKS